jgi:hypothetical protein
MAAVRLSSCLKTPYQVRRRTVLDYIYSAHPPPYLGGNSFQTRSKCVIKCEAKECGIGGFGDILWVELTLFAQIPSFAPTSVIVLQDRDKDSAIQDTFGPFCRWHYGCFALNSK